MLYNHCCCYSGDCNTSSCVYIQKVAPLTVLLQNTRYFYSLLANEIKMLFSMLIITVIDEIGWLRWLVVFNATFNNISVMSWWSVLLVEETRRKSQTCRKSLTNLSHNVVSSTPHHERGSISQL